jgi:F0F1-type ATP synthase membrane subunit b/b'
MARSREEVEDELQQADKLQRAARRRLAEARVQAKVLVDEAIAGNRRAKERVRELKDELKEILGS